MRPKEIWAALTPRERDDFLRGHFTEHGYGFSADRLLQMKVIEEECSFWHHETPLGKELYDYVVGRTDGT